MTRFLATLPEAQQDLAETVLAVSAVQLALAATGQAALVSAAQALTFWVHDSPA